MPPRPHYTARLDRTTTLSDQTKHLEFHVREMEKFEFVPGQFVSLLAMNGAKQITRAYSIASSPRSNQFDVCLNRVPGGFFSNLLCDLTEGAELKFHGPHGLFLLRKPLRDSIFIATGTGIAPMRSFVEALFGPQARIPHEGRDFRLVYGTRYEKDIYYGDYFEQVAKENPNFHYIVTLSRAQDAWTGARGYVQERVREILNARPPEARANLDAYICGLNDMVSAIRNLLQQDFGWDKKSIIFERYD